MNDSPRLDFTWFLRLRWATIALQVWIVLGVKWGHHHAFPVGQLGAIAAVLVITNVAGHVWLRAQRAPSTALFAGLMATDVLALTGVLWLTGGAANPYSVCYLIYIALAVITVPTGWAWALVALSVTGFASLFVGHDAHAAHDMAGHLQGMWMAFAITAASVVGFVGRVNGALADAQARAASVDRLASLGTLAAGAAHELSSPLSTIAIAAHELKLSLGTDADPEVLEDAALISEEVRRCRRILDRLAIDAGQTSGERPQLISAAEVLEDLLATSSDAVRIKTHIEGRADEVWLYARGVGEALRGVVENALLTGPETSVEVRLTVTDTALIALVVDDGPGMSAEVLTRATEPFFTTRATGEGMGLGLFLARSLAERAGGALTLQSTVGQGTTVRMAFPLCRS